MVVAGVERPSRRPGDDTPRAADVDHDRLRPEDDPRNGGIAGQALHGRRRDRERVLDVTAGRAGRATQRVERRRDLKVRTLRKRAGVLDVTDDLDERIGIAAFPAAIVVIPAWQCQRLDGAAKRCATDRIQPTLEEERAVAQPPVAPADQRHDDVVRTNGTM